MDEEKKYEEVSEQNQPEGKPTLPEVEATKINTGLSQEDKDRLDLARKKAEAVMPYQQIENMIKTQASEYAPESEEDRKKREKREKSKRIIGAVTDGLSALGNLFFTSRYAPNMYNPEQSQLAAVNRWADKLKAEREARRDRYEALQGKLGDLAINKARTVREIEAQHEAQKIARERAQREEEEAKRKAKMFEPQYQEALSKAEGAGYDTQAKKAAADAAPEQQRLKTENLGLEGQVKKSQIYKNTAQGGAAQRSHRGENQFDYNGETYYNYDNLEKQVNKDIENYKRRHRKGQKMKEVDEKDTSGNPTGRKVLKPVTDAGGRPVYEYDETYIPIENGYWEETANGSRWNYYDARDNAAKMELILEQTRGGGNQGKKKANPMGEASQPNKGKKANPMN